MHEKSLEFRKVISLNYACHCHLPVGYESCQYTKAIRYFAQFTHKNLHYSSWLILMEKGYQLLDLQFHVAYRTIGVKDLLKWNQVHIF